jgi:hypothetical protein
MMSNEQRFKPQYRPPPAYNTKPVRSRTPQRPTEPRPILVQPNSSRPPAQPPVTQVIDPPFYQFQNGGEPIKDVPPPIY